MMLDVVGMWPEVKYVYIVRLKELGVCVCSIVYMWQSRVENLFYCLFEITKQIVFQK